MAYQMTITLSDEEYATLAAEAARSSKPIELVAHEVLSRQITISQKQSMSSREFMEQQYREGKITHVPTRKLLTNGELTERERLAQVFAGGKPASEMVIEDRGPKE